MADCNHDYNNPIKHGRACWLCKLCGQDISLVILLIAETKIKEREQILDQMVIENQEMGLYDEEKINEKETNQKASEEKEFIIIPKDDSERAARIAKIAEIIIDTHFKNNKDKFTEAILEYFYTGSIENYFKEQK